MVTHSSLLTMIVNERCIDYHIRFYITVRVLYTQYNLMYAKINMDDEDMGILLLAIYASEKLRQKKREETGQYGLNRILRREKQIAHTYS